MSYQLLVAEDDPDIVQLLTLYLEKEGWHVFAAPDGTRALQLAQENRIDLAVLDIMMPGLNGYELTRLLRAQSRMPILILSAKQEDADKILGLDLGADDYLTKPFNPLEVVARIKANLPRFYELGGSAGAAARPLQVGALQLDCAAMTLTKSGAPIALTPTEYKILALLMRSPGHVYTKVQLYENACGAYFESDDSTMMVHISNLRDKIEDDPRDPHYIKTVRGLGYKIENGEA